MPEHRNQVNDKTKGTLVWVVCTKCGPETKQHMVLASVEVTDGHGDDNYWIDVSSTNELIQCGGCLAISMRMTASNSEDYDHNDDGSISYVVSENLYPPRENLRQARIFEDWKLPAEVTRIYQETLSALNKDLKVLAGTGLRALVEAVCNERQAKGSDLQKKIDDLVAKQILTKAGSEILHQIRALGNKAVHEMKPHGMEQLALAMDVVEHLLEEVYILPAAAANTFEKVGIKPTVPPVPPAV
jgi:hypothetical protein